jgi:hypothetical protein
MDATAKTGSPTFLALEDDPFRVRWLCQLVDRRLFRAGHGHLPSGIGGGHGLRSAFGRRFWISHDAWLDYGWLYAVFSQPEGKQKDEELRECRQDSSDRLSKFAA